MNVEPCTRPRAFPSFTAAIRHAMSHPRLQEARRDAARLADADFVDACWTWFEWVVRFDCDISLHVWIQEREVRWTLKPSSEVSTDGGFERVGSPPVMLNWVNTIGLREMDRSSFVARRRGARFKDLFVGDHGLHLYLHDHLVLNFGIAQRVDNGINVIYVFEDD